MRRSGRMRRGAVLVEYIFVYSLLLLPLTFMIIFTAQLLWVWHSVAEFTREGARYASTHCVQSGGQNVISYMRSRVPLMADRDQFISGQAEISVQYFIREPETNTLVEFTCDSDECSSLCVPDTVTVRVSQYEFRGFQAFLGLPPLALPNFQTSLPMESVGCDPEQGVCLP